MSDSTPEATPTRLEPPISKVSTPFWDATREQRLVLQRCDACDRAVWFPRAICPHCHNTSLTWGEATGTGTVHAVSVQYRPGNPYMKDRVPYAVALVDLDDGVRIMSNVIGCEPETVSVGQAVKAAWEPLTDGRNLLVFEPADSPS